MAMKSRPERTLGLLRMRSKMYLRVASVASSTRRMVVAVGGEYSLRLPRIAIVLFGRRARLGSTCSASPLSMIA